ncbi:hypothetical protein B0H19DRAFT_1062468 [Mycena capillaripes]|nr:hypothetical protein B0H19DRAFT_1062468 [Mycena capillaripes]
MAHLFTETDRVSRDQHHRETMAQFIKDRDFPVINVENANEDTLDLSQLPIGALGMSAATRVTGTRSGKVPAFPSTNYGNTVAGLQHRTIPTFSMGEHLWRADHGMHGGKIADPRI